MARAKKTLCLSNFLTLPCVSNFFPNFPKKMKFFPIVYSKARTKNIHVKTWSQKSRDTVPLKGRFSRSFTKRLYIKQLYPGHRLVLVHLANFKVCRESAEIFPSVIDLPVQMAAEVKLTVTLFHEAEFMNVPLRFLGVILRVLRLEIFVHNVL